MHVEPPLASWHSREPVKRGLPRLVPGNRMATPIALSAGTGGTILDGFCGVSPIDMNVRHDPRQSLQCLFVLRRQYAAMLIHRPDGQSVLGTILPLRSL